MTPIPDELLAQPANSYIALGGEQTLLDALYELQRQDGSEWWFLIVDLGDGRYLAARFSDLRERVRQGGRPLLDMPLKDLGEPLVDIEVVDQFVDLSLAQERANESPIGLVVVVRERPQAPDSSLSRRSKLASSGVIGVLNIGGTRGTTDFDGSSLLELAGLQGETAPQVALPEDEIDDVVTPTVQPPSPTRGRKTHPSSPEERRVESDARIDVDIDGDVGSGGQVIVAGDDVNITYTGAPPEETRDQFRRFEAAFPREVHLGVEEKLFVAVLLPDAPSPFGGEVKPHTITGTDEVAIPTPIDHKTGKLKPVDIEIAITATGYKVKGASSKSLTVWPDGRTATRWFLLEAEEVGRQEIMIELSYEGRLLAEITLESQVFEPTKKAREFLNLSLRVATFNLQFSFAAG